MTGSPLLEVSGLGVSLPAAAGFVRAVDNVSLTLDRGEVLAVVGESGSGKSAAMTALMGLTAPGGRVEGSVRLCGEELVGAGEAELRRVRGRRMAMVFQDALGSLDPVMRVGTQIVEQIRAHDDVSKAAARERAAALLERMGLPRSREVLDAYPHELSGGMRQRAFLAMALSCGPELLIADEPTAALDVTVEVRVLELIETIRERAGTAVLLVTHDIGVAARAADRIAVMYAGRIVEEGAARDVLRDPQHPYTWGLLDSVPAPGEPGGRLRAIPGSPPPPGGRPAGCHFRPRCPHELPECTSIPGLEHRVEGAPRHTDRCWLTVDAKRALRDGGRQDAGHAPEAVR